jgi:predicted CopG family antitoxin
MKLKRLKSSEKESFSDVIVKYYPARKKLSVVLAEIGVLQDLADSIEMASHEMRQTKMRGADL